MQKKIPRENLDSSQSFPARRFPGREVSNSSHQSLFLTESLIILKHSHVCMTRVGNFRYLSLNSFRAECHREESD
jgi:hypothetical protein